MNVPPDQKLVEGIATDLGVDPSFIEKDWHAMRMVSVLAGVEHSGFCPVFSGGTSLSKAYGLIQRFSEDLDFKLNLPEADVTRGMRRGYRYAILDAIHAVDDWTVQENAILVRDEGRFFSIPIRYPNLFAPAQALRPELRLDVSFAEPVLLFEERSLRSFIAIARQDEPEVAAIACVSPVETAADKLSALTWRVINRERGGKGDDPTFIRHLHDIAALENHAESHPKFPWLLNRLLVEDAHRGRSSAEVQALAPAERVTRAITILGTDPEYPREYEQFVLAMSYAAEKDRPQFEKALETVRRLGAGL